MSDYLINVKNQIEVWNNTKAEGWAKEGFKTFYIIFTECENAGLSDEFYEKMQIFYSEELWIHELFDWVDVLKRLSNKEYGEVDNELKEACELVIQHCNTYKRFRI